ncbi:MAG: filamentous hemagglutinin N-terminal domain-containing protein [Symploca sp. SIO3E6]|nr:filamentous hemagglutinin N-terminal domain-containing protein [Caldora sp. SIO3E6]
MKLGLLAQVAGITIGLGGTVNLLAVQTAQAIAPVAENPAIIPDNTLGNEPSLVIPIHPQLDHIGGGALRGSALFHSFLEFNINEGKAAYFINPSEAGTIFSRVTGNNPSQLLGTLGVIGDANLIFSNHNGILFGLNFRLDMKGSFVPNTADSISLPGGHQFSGTNPQNVPLLDIDVDIPIGLVFEGGPPAAIINQAGVNRNSELSFPWQLEPEQHLAFVGGEVLFEGSQLLSQGGSVEIAAVGEGVVTLNPTATNLNLGYEEVESFADIQLSEAQISTEGGEVQLWGRQISLVDGAHIFSHNQGSEAGKDIALYAEERVVVSGTSVDAQIRSGISSITSGRGSGGNVLIDTGELAVTDDSAITVATVGSGPGGDLRIRATESVKLSGTGFADFQENYLEPPLTRMTGLEDAQNGLISGSSGSGSGGNIVIETGKLILEQGAAVWNITSNQGDGGNIIIHALDSVELKQSGLITGTGDSRDAGNIEINTQRLKIHEGGILISATIAEGSSGDVLVEASESVEILRTQSTIEQLIGTGIYVNTTFGNGPGGQLSIDTEKLIIHDGGVIVNNSGASLASTIIPLGGQGGDVTVNADYIEIAGTSADGKVSSGFGTTTFSDNDAGDLSITTTKLMMSGGGRITTGTAGAGRGGTLTINAESIELQGKSTDISFSSSFLATSGRTDLTEVVATGAGGEIQIFTEGLMIKDGAEISVASFGSGEAGNIEIIADTLELDNGSIKAETISGAGGNIQLQVQKLLVLRNDSQISATAGTAMSGGDGGNIFIDAEKGFLVTFPEGDSEIAANAFTGDGGNINIKVSGILNPDPSQITASSEQGRDGEVNIDLLLDNQPGEEPLNRLEPPVEVELIEGCQVGKKGEYVEFSSVGEGGYPPAPEDIFDTTVSTWIPLPSLEQDSPPVISKETANVDESIAREDISLPSKAVPASRC